MSDDLLDRVEQFTMMKLPGQPMAMHMGTLYLVNDLAREVERLSDMQAECNAAIARAERAEAKLKEALREIYEVYAGSEGLPASTASEAYLTRLILEMAKIAGTALAEAERNER